MFFGKKKKKNIECKHCNSKINKTFSFCPYCGNPLTDKEKEMKDFGMLGKIDSDILPTNQDPTSIGISDKMINSIFNKLMKNLNSQLGDIHNMDNAEISNIPNGIKIKIGAPKIKKQPTQKKGPFKKPITTEQIEKMSKLPRTPAKTSVKRLSNRIVYELTTPGLATTKDVFISKLESGYEIKAIGSKKVYVNTIPLNLPLKNLSLLKNRLFLEFHTQPLE